MVRFPREAAFREQWGQSLVRKTCLTFSRQPRIGTRHATLRSRGASTSPRVTQEQKVDENGRLSKDIST